MMSIDGYRAAAEPATRIDFVRPVSDSRVSRHLEALT